VEVKKARKQGEKLGGTCGCSTGSWNGMQRREGKKDNNARFTHQHPLRRIGGEIAKKKEG